MEFKADAVLALAPDDASAKAARGLTSPAKWPTLGANEAAVWGECQGSGSKPYQTQVDLAGPTFKCSCPSRKFPCKHGLALLLIRSSDASLFKDDAAPAWVEEWLAARKDRAEKKEQRAAEKAAAPPPSPEAVARREGQRWQHIEDGLAQLQLWMADQVERGLASLGADARAGFQAMAARLVDAQAPGLAQRLRECAEHVGSAPDWPARVLRCFGSLQLVIEAVQRRAALSPETLADLRATLGWTLDKDDVLAAGARVQDEWLVLAVAQEQRDAKLVERRVWLQGQASGRRALLLDFSFGATGFEQAWLAGHACRAELAFFPAAAPLRALCLQQDDVKPAAAPAAGPPEWQQVAERYAGNPWLRLQPLLFAAATPVYAGEAWTLHTDATQVPLRLAAEPGWLLAAHSGGAPLTVFGEWDGDCLTPLSAWNAGGLWTNGALA